jgi:hypothetical protein
MAITLSFQNGFPANNAMLLPLRLPSVGVVHIRTNQFAICSPPFISRLIIAVAGLASENRSATLPWRPSHSSTCRIFAL